MDGISLRAEAAGSGARVLEVAAESGDHEGTEDDVGTTKSLLISARQVKTQKKKKQGRTDRKTGSDSQRRKMNLKV